MSDKVTYDPISKLWAGPKENYPYGNKSAGEVIYQQMLENSSRICQISDDTGEISTNERMLKTGISFANALENFGLKRGDVILVLLHNHHYSLSVTLGSVLAGVIFCPFHYEDSNIKENLSVLLEKIKPKIMVTSYLDDVQIFRTTFNDLGIDCPIYVYENQLPGCHDLKPLLEDYFTSFENFKPKPVENPNKEIIAIFMSSATTGNPKLVIGTHKQIMMNFAADSPKFNVATTCSPGWMSEYIFMMGCLLKSGTRIVRAHYDMEDVLLMLEKHKVHLFGLKPCDIYAMLKLDLLKKVDLSELMIIICSGSHLSIKVAQEFQKYVPDALLVSSYGTSELGRLTDMSELDPDTPNLVGLVKKNSYFCVLDDNEKRLGPNEVGEICIKSDTPFAGYYKDEELTKAALTDDGFIRTGDLGYLDEDGNVFLIERKKFFINYQDKQLNQWHVERIIYENVEGIEACCVVDVESKSHGVMPYIAIQPDKNAKLSATNIIATVMEHHPFKFETKVFFFEKLPTTISGKVKKFMIREMIKKQMNE